MVKNVLIPPDTEGTLPIELDDVMPLLQFLAPVCLLRGFVSISFSLGVLSLIYSLICVCLHLCMCLCVSVFLKSSDWLCSTIGNLGTG